MSTRRRPARGTTLKAIAEEAGVSITLVSKVLHGRAPGVRVSDDTAELVRETARRLNYVPNALARGLRMNRSETVGLIFENFGRISSGPLYYPLLFDGVAEVVFGRHYRLTILPEVDPVNPMAALGDGRLDGILWCKMPGDAEFLRRIQDCPIPIVALNAPPPRETHESVFVACDNAMGAELAVDHLVKLGHRQIAFALEQNEERTPDALARLEGYRQALERRDLDPQSLVLSPDAREFGDWFSQNPHVTAVLAWNEGLGSAILRVCAARDIIVPNQISVVGFDSTAYCEATLPRLTAARQPIREMAAAAAELLFDLIDGKKPPVSYVTYPCTLDVRDSTASPSRHRLKEEVRSHAS